MQTVVEGEGMPQTAEAGMVIERRFTTAGADPFNGFEWGIREIEIHNADGSVAFDIGDIELPTAYSDVAAKVLSQKYLRRAGVPSCSRPIPEAGVPVWLQRHEPDEEKLQKLPATERFGSESSGKQVFRRLAGTWTYWGWKHDYFASEIDARAYYDEMCYLLASQMSAPNSPQWFNTGLNWAYGIDGPAQGHWYVDPKTGVEARSENAYEHPQPHACFIQSVGDDLVGEGGIMDLWTREARLFKYGSGTGSNFSNIRGEDEPLSGGGKSSGLLSFLKIGDRAAGAIKSGGTTRRAAKMVSLDMDHPDIQNYINWKVKEEEKVSALVAGSAALQKHCNSILAAIWSHTDDATRFNQESNPNLAQALREAVAASIAPAHMVRVMDLAKQGWKSIKLKAFDVDWQGEAYLTVSGQNSNNSVRVTNDFMQSVEDSSDWNLYWRTEKKTALDEKREPEPCKTLPASELWDEVAYAAWCCADPGVQFDTTINEWHTCPEGGSINGSNPCSEYMFLDDTACNLASLNLVKFYDAERGSFRIDDYRHAIRLWTVGLEISVLMAQFPSQEIAKLSYDYRTLGLGYANIGSLLMRMGIPYDDPRGSAICGALTAIMGGVAYATSAEMAGVMGPFSRYEENEEHMLRVIRNHRRAAYATEADEYEGLTVKPMQIDSKKCPRELLEAAREAWDRALMLGEEHGYRNAQVTVIAPTGTIGLVMDCDTTGIEPDFSLVKFKSLAGGGMLRIINQAVPQALQRLGYDRNQIEDISSYVLGSGNLSGSVGITHQSLVEKGFSEEELAKLDAACDAVFDVRSLFSPTILGHQFYKSTLGVTEEELDNPFFDTLGYLGFNSTEIEIANEKVFGRLSIEGAPHLDDKHLAVFDCATACGKHGTRSIAWQAHVNMMAAAQPFISGAISKTINMPNEISVAEIKAAYKSAWETMNKACAIYRDGSKLSQPLMSSIIDTAVVEEESDDSDMMSVSDVVEQMSERIPVPKEEARKLSTRIVERYIATRRRLPDSGAGFRQKAKVGGHTVYLHTFDYENDELGEMFISMSKEGAAFRSLMNCFAISVSLGLQYGVPLEEYVESFVFTRFEPDGMVQGSKRVKMATSIIDYIFRELAIRYLGRNDLAHVSEEDIRHDAVSIPKLTEEGVVRGHGKRRDVQLRLDTIIKDESETSAEVTGNPQIKVMTEARERGFTGDMCDDCGAMTMVRNGTCLKCESCGATTGCS